MAQASDYVAAGIIGIVNRPGLILDVGQPAQGILHAGVTRVQIAVIVIDRVDLGWATVGVVQRFAHRPVGSIILRLHHLAFGIDRADEVAVVIISVVDRAPVWLLQVQLAPQPIVAHRARIALAIDHLGQVALQIITIAGGDRRGLAVDKVGLFDADQPLQPIIDKGGWCIGMGRIRAIIFLIPLHLG